MDARLQREIKEANARAGRGRQKVYAKKAYMRQTDAQVIEMLCARANELFAAVKEKGDTRAALNGLAEAVRIAERRG